MSVTKFTTKSPISVFIICKNEERLIGSVLEQAGKFAKEIIVVDSGSTDSTLEIVAKYTDKIYQQDWLGYGKQKNFALSKCSYEWVLSIDADEVLTNELIEEISKLPLVVTASSAKKFSLDYPGYQIARKFFIGDKFICHGGYYPDYQLRLFKKSLGRFCESPVHESVELYDPATENYSKDRSNCPKLKNPLNHYSYSSIDEMKNSFRKFAELSTKSKNIFKAFIAGIYTFVYKFVLRLGFMNGLLGLQLALVHAEYSFRKYLK